MKPLNSYPAVVEGVILALLCLGAACLSGLISRVLYFAWRVGYELPDVLFSLLH